MRSQRSQALCSASLHIWCGACVIKRLPSGTHSQTFADSRTLACSCHVIERLNHNKSVALDVKTKHDLNQNQSKTHIYLYYKCTWNQRHFSSYAKAALILWILTFADDYE